jgi:hypothetical protein
MPLLAQEQAKPEAKPEQKPAEAKTEAKAEAKSESPAPAAEPSFSGSVDVGYRWVSTAGSYDVYRSVVNLGEGPKLLGWDLSFEDPRKRLFDRLDLRGNNWGGDPYNTAFLAMRKMGVYNLTVDYRNIAFFNFLPSYADPLATSTYFLDERSYDLKRRLANAQLDLRPGKRVIPYLGYTWDSGYGRQINTFVTSGNEYPLSQNTNDHTANYRGGVRLEFNRFHATLEQGGTTFRQDQQIYYNGRTTGNLTQPPLFSPPLYLTGLTQAYGIRGDSIYSKGLVTASPASWVDLYGQFLFSQPTTDSNYTQVNTGQFEQLSPLLYYTSQRQLLNASAKAPHTAASGGAEVRPFRRLRIIESISTDRLHTAGAGVLTNEILQPASAAVVIPGNDRVVLNYNQQQLDALFDITSRLTLRGGWRYVWGDAKVPASTLSPTPGLESAQLRRQVGLAGLTYRWGQKLSTNFDFEGSATDHAYFRTSLWDYQKFRLRARYQAWTSLGFQANFTYLNNDNPTPGINYSFTSRYNSFSVYWTPAGGKRVSLLGDYSRSTVKSDILYLVPQALQSASSLYRENAHTATAMLEVALPSYAGLTPRIGTGGSLFTAGGSRPTSFYQPLAHAIIPLQKHLSWTAEWRYYGFGEAYFPAEGFRAQTFITGIRLVR